MAVQTTNNKPINPRGNDQSPKGYNRAALYSGKALDFDGVNDSISVPYSDTLGGVWTWVSIIEPDALSGYQELFGGQYGSTNATIYLKENQLSFYTTGNNFNTAFNFETGKKYHVACSQSGDTISVYVNGQAAGSVSLTIPLNRTGGVYIIGKNPTQSIEYFNGKMSGVKLFNTALTAAQVADLYNNPEKIVPTGVDESNLKLWLPMQEGAGTTAYDGSGGGNHGTISGATWTHGVGSPVAQTAVIDWNKGTNKLQYSEELNNAYYSKASILSVDANATTAPDGLTTAENIKPDTTSNQHYLYNVGLGLTGQHTISIFAKYNGYNIGLRPQGIGMGQAFANFDLQNGTILGSGGTYYNDSNITSLGDGWYRCSLTLTYATAYGFGVYVVNGTTATELPVFSGDGTSGVYAWGAQVNAGATLTPYVRTESSEQYSPVLLPQGLTSGRDITGVNLFENVRKQGALNLDGNSWAEVHDNASLDFGSGMTLEAWIKLEDTSQAILGKWNFAGNKKEYLLYYKASTNVLQAFFGNGSSVQFTSTSYTGDGSWVHFVGTTDGSTITPYLNGVAGTTAAQTTPLGASDIPVRIGVDDTGAGYSPNQIAQPRIYNRALTAEEVQRNYDAGKNIYTNS